MAKKIKKEEFHKENSSKDEDMNPKNSKRGIGFVLGIVFGALLLFSGVMMAIIGIFGNEIPFLLSFVYIIPGLLIFPPFNNFLKQKLNITIKTWLKVLVILIVITFGPVIVIIISDTTSQEHSSENYDEHKEIRSENTIENEELKPEEVVENYIDLEEHKNWRKYLNLIESRNKYLYGDLLESNKELYNYSEKFFFSLEKNINDCLYLQENGLDFCNFKNDSILETFESLQKTKFDFTEEPVISNITTSNEHLIIDATIEGYSNGNSSNNYSLKQKFTLNNISGYWKIESIKSNYSFNTTYRKVFNNRLSESLKIYTEDINNVSIYLNNRKNYFKDINDEVSTIDSLIPNFEIIKKNIIYGNDKYSNTLSLSYMYEDKGFMSSDYLTVLEDASNIFSTLFSNTNSFENINIISIKKDVDAYGNEQFKQLSLVKMNRETYKKINWEKFDYTRLDEITTVDFYEDSIYKDLKDLENMYSEPSSNVDTELFEEMIRNYR